MKALFSIQAVLFITIFFVNYFHGSQSELLEECCVNNHGNITRILNVLCDIAKSMESINEGRMKQLLQIGDDIKKDNDNKPCQQNCEKLAFNNCFEWYECAPSNKYCSYTGNLFSCKCL